MHHGTLSVVTCKKLDEAKEIDEAKEGVRVG